MSPPAPAAPHGRACEDCKKMSANYGLPPSHTGQKTRKRWCASCGARHGAVNLHQPVVRAKAVGAVPVHKQQMCEGCGLKWPNHGLASEGKKRWCASCGEAKGAVSLQKQKMCEGCGLKQRNYGLALERKARWLTHR